MRFSRQQEAAADEGGLQRLQKVEVDSGGYQRFFERARESSVIPEILSDHPADSDRAERAKKYRSMNSRPILDLQAWKKLQAIFQNSNLTDSA
jgi:predicted Zn-dependent protease